MSQRVEQYSLVALVIALGLLAVVAVNGQMSGVLRWNPRRVPADAVLIGDQACGECHKKHFASYGRSGMAEAMEPVAASKVLDANPQLRMRGGPYTDEIKRNGKQSFYSVSDGKDTISSPILYAFGQGRMGQTYLLERDGQLYESLVSFYSESKALDFTVGAPRGVPESLTEAVGHLLSAKEVSSCFSCHATGVFSGTQLRPEKFTHGVGCEV